IALATSNTRSRRSRWARAASFWDSPDPSWRWGTASELAASDSSEASTPSLRFMSIGVVAKVRRDLVSGAGLLLIHRLRLVAVRVGVHVATDIRQQPQRNEEPAPPTDATRRGGNQDVKEGRPGQKDQAEEWPDPRAERTLDVIGEGP